MNSRFHGFGGRMGTLAVTELSKDRTKADVTCDVQFLDHSTHSFKICKQADGHVLLDMVFNHLGLAEKNYFGLQFSEDSESPRWLDPNKPIKKQFKGSIHWVLNFRVRFFITDPNSLQQQQSRHLYFLQIKSDIRNGRLSCPLSSAVVLASYAVQAELGDHSSTEHQPGYLSLFRFFPGQEEDFLPKVEAMHPQHRGLKPSEAELCYLNTARTLDFYGVELHHARDSSNSDLQVGIASGGLAVFRNKVCSSFFSWVSIVKISFKRKRFLIQLRQKHRESRDSTVTFNMLNYRTCKNLWRSCVEHHAFFQSGASLSLDKKLLFSHGTLTYKNPTNLIMCRMMRGVVLNPALRKSLSVENLDTRSLPSFSPPTTPSWRSPRLRHNIRKTHHSSMDNLASEMSYFPETEDVFYTYKIPEAAKGIGLETSADQKKIHKDRKSKEAGPDLRSCTLMPASGQEAVVPTQQASTPPGQPDSPSLDSEGLAVEGTANRDSQCYSDKNEEIEGDLLLVRMAPDKDGKFGFNVKGGADQKMPLMISHVAHDSPAGRCTPELLEGDQILLINGRDISEHNHDQVVMFIKASRESHTKELTLLVRRKGDQLYVSGGPLSTFNAGFQLLGDSTLPQGHQIGESLEDSMVHIKKGLQTGSLLVQFEQLYRKKQGLEMVEARLTQNMEKNRYKDVLPYDITRVVLQDKEDNYINASHIKMEVPGTEVVNYYVAAQGPLPHTCCHFWRSVWEQHSRVIIMLTTLTERGRPKCHQYWPDPPELRDYEGLQIRCHSEECNLAYVFREFTLICRETGEERTVFHLQYVAWPDHGVPDDPSDFLDFVKFVRKKRKSTEPLMVHCSAGIGRTGVFITMETAMQLIEKKQPVYPLDLVRKMRDQRSMMVQTGSQYRFICEAILRVYSESLDNTPG
ncbi:tyrosine-protein phosphatase non-receptor type 3 [Brienomyrus brachyistius]|uniref:tyrosine-protein phosphatase non-receptor type 3 n=1 Tax=Brienomyrus brachyistius TaxID=42636 RepID=UPI0020B26DF2|nr:tyrosine-protein phosphatase non-receptor type 3 [Brienomyrus brachyistius]